MLPDKLVRAGIIVLIFSDWLQYPCPLSRFFLVTPPLRKYASMQECKYARMQVHASMQVYKYMQVGQVRSGQLRTGQERPIQDRSSKDRSSKDRLYKGR